MKVLLIATVCLLGAHLGEPRAAAECVEVTPYNWSLTPQPSSGNVQIIVKLDGTPLPHASIIVSIVREYREQFLFSVSADVQGVAQLSDLKPGRYHVVGVTAQNVSADLLLDVSAKPEKRATLFSLNLLSPAALGRQFALGLTGKMGVSERLREFTGTVQDQSGAAVANAVVEIYPDGDGKPASTVSLKADETGHFSAALPDGVYRAVIHLLGFKPYPVVFQIVQDADAKDLLVVLKVASC